jgi:hypothetical protein
MLDYIDLNPTQTIQLLELDPILDDSAFRYMFKMSYSNFEKSIQRSRVFEDNSFYVWVSNEKFCLYEADPDDCTYDLAKNIINT